MQRCVSALAAGVAGLAACAVLSSCASRGLVVNTAQLWPFEQLTIDLPAVGVTTGYLSRPEGTPDRFIVVVQEPLCTAPDRISADAASLGTAGLLWSEFKSDALFLQFERPGARASASREKAPCKLRRRERPEDLWQRAVSEATVAVRERERLTLVPTVYIGIAGGALPAWAAAVNDANVDGLVLINAALNEDRETQRLMARLRPRLSIGILHVDHADRASLENALKLFAMLQSKQQPSSMFVFESVGDDFGLTL